MGAKRHADAFSSEDATPQIVIGSRTVKTASAACAEPSATRASR
jgi:hypothetical protein